MDGMIPITFGIFNYQFEILAGIVGMIKINTIIVGQGIAGSLVAFMLHRKNIPFLVIDPANQNTASRIAAGMYTPLSGKRKTILPLVLEQIPFAQKIYREIGDLIGQNILHPAQLYQLCNSSDEQGELLLKSSSPQYAPFIAPVSDTLPGVQQKNGAFAISHSGWVNCAVWMELFGIWLKKNDRLLEAIFSYQEVHFGEDRMEYRGMEFKNIFFCEGYEAINNPFFKEKIIPCKGDVLSISCDYAAVDQITKKNGIYLVPTATNRFKVGATYQWDNDALPPDQASKKWIEDQLADLLINPFATIDHQSAIRPTTKNREVIVQQHLEHKGMFMLNGLGTKGVLQGPWWAQRIVDLCIQ
jgi:glycine/D-amino acid oxidase-like deaminating enzyme